MYRIRLVVGGDKLDYEFDAGSPATNLLETKILLNSVISDASKGARFLTLDIKDHFLATPMKEPEFMKIPWKYFPEDIRKRYNLELLVENGYVYVKIKKGMYGLKQAAILAYTYLADHLKTYGYTHVPGTMGIFTHVTHPTRFCLCVDDFGVKYYSEDNKNHLINALRDKEKFTITVDESGKQFCGLTLDWNYDRGYVDISMPDYVRKTLKRLHPNPKTPQYSPHEHVPIRYGKKGEQQFAPESDSSTLLPSSEIRNIQSIVGTYLYYARAIDNTILTALNDISHRQATLTIKTKEKCERLMDYLATYPDVYLRFYASDMQLHVETDAAYLVLPKARSRIAGFFHLSSKFNKSKPNQNYPTNGPILIECKTIRRVVTSAAEAEVAGLFHNTQTTLHIRHILEALNHPQHPTPIKTDNSTAVGFAYDNINQKRSKAWDMNYYWLREKENHNNFHIYWQKGKLIKADYHTKHHPILHHRAVRSTYVRDRLTEIKHTAASIVQTCKYL